MKPIAEALDILQGDVGAGLVIPTNWILRQKLEQVHVCDATPLPSHFFHFSPSCWSSFQFGSKGGKRLPISWWQVFAIQNSRWIGRQEEKLWLLQRLRREVESPPESQGDESCSDSSINDFFRKKRNNLPLLPWMHISKTQEKTWECSRNTTASGSCTVRITGLQRRRVQLSASSLRQHWSLPLDERQWPIHYLKC